MRPIELSGPEEFFRIRTLISKGEYDKLSAEDKLKVKIVNAQFCADVFSARLEAVDELIHIARSGEDCIKRAMEVLSSLMDEYTTEDLKTSLIDQEDRLKSIEPTEEDPDAWFVHQLPSIVLEILCPAESFSNRTKKS